MSDEPLTAAPATTVSRVLFASAFVSVLGIAVQIVRSKVLALALGPTGIGLIAEITQIVSLLFAPLNAVVSVALVKWLADEEKAAGRYLGIGHTLFLLLPWSGGVGLLALFAGPRFLPTNVSGHAREYLLYSVLSTALATIPNCINVYLVVRRRMKAMATLAIVTSVSSTVIILALTLAFGIRGQMIGMATSSALSAWIAILFARKEAPGFSIAPRYSGAFARAALALGALWLLTSYGQQLRFAAARSSLQRVGGGDLGLQWNGNYQAALAIGDTYIGLVLSGLQNYFLPRLAQASPEELHSEVRASLTIYLRSIGPILLLVIGFRAPIIHALYSDRFVDAIPLLGYFALGDAVRCLAVVLLNALSMKKRVVAYVTSELVSNLVAAASTPFLVQHFHVNGPGIANCLYYALLLLCASIATRRALGISIGWAHLAAGASLAAACFALDRVIQLQPAVRWLITPLLVALAWPTLRPLFLPGGRSSTKSPE